MGWLARLRLRSAPDSRTADSGADGERVTDPAEVAAGGPDLVGTGQTEPPTADGAPAGPATQRTGSEDATATYPIDGRNAANAVPYGVRVAAAWSWRTLVIAAAAALAGYALVSLSVVVIPAVVAILLTALTIPLVNLLHRIGVPRFLAAATGLVAVIVLVGGLLTLVGQQIAVGFTDLGRQVLEGIEQIRRWLIQGPLDLSNAQLQDFFDRLVEQGQRFLQTGGQEIAGGVLGVATTVTTVIAGFFLVLFASLFFLYEGERIWTWVVCLFPRHARDRIDGAGRVGWKTLTSFVRATVLVALVDAIGIGLIALLLDVPFWFPIAVLVFLGAFVPIIGAVVSGFVAVLVALVAQGLWIALLMLIGVLAVQQVESNVLQPLLMGRMVRVHPLAVVLAVGAGVYVAGIAGAFFAVPIVAILNSAVGYLVRRPAESSEGTGSAPVEE